MIQESWGYCQFFFGQDVEVVVDKVQIDMYVFYLFDWVVIEGSFSFVCVVVELSNFCMGGSDFVSFQVIVWVFFQQVLSWQ